QPGPCPAWPRRRGRGRGRAPGRAGYLGFRSCGFVSESAAAACSRSSGAGRWNTAMPPAATGAPATLPCALCHAFRMNAEVAPGYRTIEVSRIAGALGAEIRGVDLRSAPAGEQLAEIRRGWLEHLVIVFRDQSLAPAQMMGFARAIGTPVEYPFVRGIEGWPEIIEVKKLEHERVNFGGVWHSDTTYLDEPPMASMLLAREVPPFGGDTLFANMYLAYEALSAGLRATLDGLVGVSSSAKADVTKTREDRIRSGGRDEARTEYVAEHP